MEMSDGLDFEAWNATVRSLASAVDRLDKTVRQLAAPPWMNELLTELGELNLHLARLDEAQLWLPRASLQSRSPTSASATSTPDYPPASEESDLASETELPVPVTPDKDRVEVAAESPLSPAAEATVPVRFGDPAAIARYGGGSRRRR